MRLARAGEPHGAAARNPPRRDRRRRAARLPLLPARRRGLRAGRDRAHLVRRGRAVRAGDHRRHLLEGRHPRRRARRARRRLRRLALHAAAAVVRQVGLAADRLPRARAVRHRAAEALRAVRARGPERHHARDALEHDRQRRRLRRGVGADAAERGRAGAGGALRRRVPARRRRPRRARVEGHRVAAGPAGAARALPRRGAGAGGAWPTTRGGAASARAAADAGRRRARAVRGDRRSPARSAGRRRGSWSPRRSRRTRCRSTRCATMLDEASQVIAYSHELEQKSQELDARPPPSCAPPTSGCRSSTG